MILIIGGAFQGKLDYAKEAFALKEKQIFDCTENDNAMMPYLDPMAKCYDHLDRFVLACVREEIDAKAYFEKTLEAQKDKIFLLDDVTQGVVPMDATERAWREEVGRVGVFLAQHADQVIRIFCGIPQVIKG